MREISIDGCEIVGMGAIGTVYRIDEDTIVKVYNIPDCIPMIENEQKRSKQAFLKGIPTAISYDIVKVGDRYGSVFEMLKASTFSEMVIRHPERREETIRQYARFIRQVHSVMMDPGELPDAKEVFRTYLDDLGSVVPEDIRAWLVRLLDAMPENLHVVHGDIQLKNVMVSGGEPLLIDMDTLSVGDPVFDLMCLFVTYRLYPEDDPLNIQEFQGISQETADFFCDKGLQYYFEGRDEEFIRKEKDRIMVLACVRFLHLVAVMDIGKPELRQTRISRALEHLKGLQGKVDTLETRF